MAVAGPVVEHIGGPIGGAGAGSGAGDRAGGEVVVTCDASVDGSGAGGWAAEICDGSGVKLVGGRMLNCRASDMAELFGVVRALASVPGRRRVLMRVDALSVVSIWERARGWSGEWVARGGLARERGGFLKAELWHWMGVHRVTMEHVKGHAGDAANQRVHRVANQIRKVGLGGSGAVS